MAPTKKHSLAAAMQEASGRKPAPAPVTAAPEAEQAAPAPAARDERPSRQGKKVISGHFDPAVSRQLKQLALDNGSNVQALLAEALNDLFEKHGRKPIA